MESSSLRYIYCGDITVAATYETELEQVVDSSFPMTVLIYVAQGDKHYQNGNIHESFPEGSYMLIRKFTEGTLSKSVRAGQALSKSYAFALTDSFVRDIINEIHIPSDLPPISKRVIGLKKNDLLVKLMEFVRTTVEEGSDIDADTFSAKTKEAIKAIIKADPSLAVVFKEYTLAERIDLSAFMNQSYLLRVPLKIFAMQSGRSLSTFHRDFKMIFGETPHRWIMKKRLKYARKLLDKDGLKPSDVYILAGFEDLAHFSRAFKKFFGHPPSKLVSLN